ncbi:LysR family transcriptional regulator [Pseudomonas fortuita]|uniref:LysR family transcriptional regulator n=1 Tax=Pseudomonas fortuita TaxID=3233375 RepID=UPI003DA00E44
MQVFVSVVETGSFTNAAQSLHMHRPAVSKSIQLLEQRLDGRLLNRSTRRLSMTREGEAFYHRCKACWAGDGFAERSSSAVGREATCRPAGIGRTLARHSVAHGFPATLSWDRVDAEYQ